MCSSFQLPTPLLRLACIPERVTAFLVEPSANTIRWFDLMQIGLFRDRDAVHGGRLRVFTGRLLGADQDFFSRTASR